LNTQHIRALGATAGEMLLVARGDVDAFIDIRDKLTLENFAPFFLIAKHTDSILTDEKGQKIKINDLSLSKGYNIIFSKDKKTHYKILKMLNH
jgi:myo-inositol-1(or 4)-monophosphatase